MHIPKSFVFLLISFFSLLVIEDTLAQTIFIPTAGNTWVTNNTKDKIDKTGIIVWEDSESILTTYFKVDKTGYVDIAFLGSCADSSSTLAFAMNGQSYSIMVNNANEDTIKIGRFAISKIGYQQLNMQGVNKTGEHFPIIKGFFVNGTCINQQTIFVKDDFYWGRRGPSVHLKYKDPAETEVVYFYNEITVPKGEDVIGSYFMANGFAEGYFGIQVNSEKERRILFSVWSPYKTDDPGEIPEDYRIKMLAKGERVHTGEFGNEGSGGQSYWKFMWQAGNTYRFLLKGEPSENNSTDYTAWFYAPELAKWKLIASFRRPKTTTYLKRLHSFLENFVPNTGYKSRMLYYTNQWVYDTNNQWQEITQATFTADATARKGARVDYFGGANGNQFFLKNCGFFNTKLNIGSSLNRTAAGNPPHIDFTSLPYK
jgi:hypothetical protein